MWSHTFTPQRVLPVWFLMVQVMLLRGVALSERQGHIYLYLYIVRP